MTTERPVYRLAPPAAPPVAPALDEQQRRVVEHPGGPLLVLAGPGTGKTTTMVEAIVERVERRGLAADQVLALTFSRKAAAQLRDRVAARLGRTSMGALAATFHSFAYGLVREFAPAELYEAPLRLLAAPEQDVVLRELLAHEAGGVRWPEGLRAAIGTRGFAREVQAVLSRARERGLDPADLEALGHAEQAPELAAAGAFMRQYLDVLGSQSAIDYADLIVRAVAEAERHRDRLRARYSSVFVDEYQDSDPSQVALLQALAGDGRDLVVVGDPDQSIYGFRGAEVRGILQFPAEFPTAGGERAPVIALGTTRRFGPRLLRASRTIASEIGVPGAIPPEAFEAFRHPVSAASTPGRVEVITFDTERAETAHLADLLRRAHVEQEVPWSEMAVLVRSGRASIPALRRALVAAGVPVEVSSDETPLMQEPAVLVLLDALALVVDASVEDPASDDYVDAGRSEALLVSPLGGLDATDVRSLVRALRLRSPETTARQVLRAAVLDPTLTEAVSGEAARRAHRVARLVERARADLADGATAEEVLWTLWAGTDWGVRLRQATETGGAAARLAHRDLDALCALFDAASRSEEQRGHTSIATFLATLRAQEIPGDTLAERGVRGEAVRLLTAHRSKGLEWRLVVVAHVQEGAWPDLRRRDSLLGADRIGDAAAGLLPPLSRSALLAEERRLFYVAATRASERLVVSAVASPEDEGEQPSRFLRELGCEVEHRIGRPRRPLSMAGLVAELRRTLADPEEPEALRDAAASRLAMLAATRVRDRSVAPMADPATWWGLRAPSVADRPIRAADQPVSLSPSALEALLTCPAQWFLQREAGGSVLNTASQAFGTLVHAVAQRVAAGELAVTDVDADLMPLVDEVWDRLKFRTPWAKARERTAIREVLIRFLNWHERPGARPIVKVEAELRVEVELPDGERVRLTGFADRLELDEDGRVVVVDFKTGKYAPTEAAVKEHPQLALYQLAVDNGAADELLGRPGAAGGAELIQLRSGKELPKVQAQPAASAGDRPILHQLARAAAAIRQEEFVARPSKTVCDRCSFTALCPAFTAGSVLS